MSQKMLIRIRVVIDHQLAELDTYATKQDMNLCDHQHAYTVGGRDTLQWVLDVMTNPNALDDYERRYGLRSSS